MTKVRCLRYHHHHYHLSRFVTQSERLLQTMLGNVKVRLSATDKSKKRERLEAEGQWLSYADIDEAIRKGSVVFDRHSTHVAGEHLVDFRNGVFRKEDMSGGILGFRRNRLQRLHASSGVLLFPSQKAEDIHTADGFDHRRHPYQRPL